SWMTARTMKHHNLQRTPDVSHTLLLSNVTQATPQDSTSGTNWPSQFQTGSGETDMEDATTVIDPLSDPFQTKFSEVELVCPKCTSTWSPPVAMTVNAGTDPECKEGVLRGT